MLVGDGTPCCGVGLKSTSRARVERNRAARKCGEIYGAEHEAHHMAPISSASGEPRGMPGCLVTNNRDIDGYFDYARFTTIAAIMHEGDVGQRSVIPYAAEFLNSVLWTFYWFSEGDMLLCYVSLFGACCMFYYMVKFLEHCNDHQFQWSLVFPTGGGFLLFVVIVYYMSDRDSNMLFFSWTCALSRGLMALVPLLSMQLGNVMAPFLLTGISLGNDIVWTGFALTGPQVHHFILWPSVSGTLSGLVQAILYILPADNGGLNAHLL